MYVQSAPRATNFAKEYIRAAGCAAHLTGNYCNPPIFPSIRHFDPFILCTYALSMFSETNIHTITEMTFTREYLRACVPTV